MPLHTQREEDIKEFDDKWDGCFSDASGDYCNPQVKDFISNIYIKMAENQIKRWTEIFDYHQDMTNDSDTYKRNTARVEINYWQEELNKLKS